MLGQHQRTAPAAITVRLAEISADDPEPAAEEPAPEPKKKKITAPKLLSKPEIVAPQSFPAVVIDHDRVVEASARKPEPSPLPSFNEPARGEWSADLKPGEAEGAQAGGGNPTITGDLAAGIGSDGTGGGGGQGLQGLGGGAKGDGSGRGRGEAPSSPARPTAGHQVKPRYPESARRANIQGTTLLKLQVLANGKVGEVLIEKSAGHRDLDNAAAEAVKKWLFEPARMGKTPVAVWVLLPVKFELE
jgi:protein TonB